MLGTYEQIVELDALTLGDSRIIKSFWIEGLDESHTLATEFSIKEN